MQAGEHSRTRGHGASLVVQPGHQDELDVEDDWAVGGDARASRSPGKTLRETELPGDVDAADACVNAVQVVVRECSAGGGA